jgi:Na+-translocating ferredoxin:NAD+ oxidoreductase RNF subunit RnfB
MGGAFTFVFLGLLGALCGVIVALESKKLSLRIDQKVDKLLGALPNIDCGACGYSSCAAFAGAVAEGKAAPTGCAPGGAKTAHDLADILGIAITAAEPQMAVVHCKGGAKEAARRSRYDGIPDCHAAIVAGNGSKVCTDGCLGLGSCVRACPFQALSISDGGVAVVDPKKCNGCGKCVGVCPRGIIELIPGVHKIYLACANHDFGLKVKNYCSIGCTACAACIQFTPSGAISMVDNLPVLDYSKEENFIVAAQKCSSRCFIDLVKARPKVNIDVMCDGCGRCVASCPVDAIVGERGKRFVVDKEKCIGCGLCLDKCHLHAIAMWGGLGYVKDASGKWKKA